MKAISDETMDEIMGMGMTSMRFLHGIVKSTRAKIEPGDLARVKPAMAVLGATSRLRATECNRLAIERAIGASGGAGELPEGKLQRQLKG